MTVEEFEAKQAELTCQHCGKGGLVLITNPNNGGVRPGCLACQTFQPIEGLTWLKQNKAKKRMVKRPGGDPTPKEVWEANGNYCAYCGKTQEDCERYGIGLSSQHVIPFHLPGGAESPLVPFCSRCQQRSAAALAETEFIRRAFESVQSQLARIRDKQDSAGHEHTA